MTFLLAGHGHRSTVLIRLRQWKSIKQSDPELDETLFIP